MKMVRLAAGERGLPHPKDYGLDAWSRSPYVRTCFWRADG